MTDTITAGAAEQRTPEWHEERRGRITASLAGAILGHSPWMDHDDAMRTLVRAWHRAPSEFTGNIATDYGNTHEEGAIIEYQMESGNAVEKSGLVMKEDWAGASPDGLIGLVGGLEVKCPFGKRKASASEDALTFKSLADQPHYEDQVQFSMWVCERAWWDFYQWSPSRGDGSDNTAWERVKPCSKWRSRNLPKLKEFYEDFLTEREMPFAQKYLEARRVEIDSKAAAALLEEHDELAEAIDLATERKKEILAALVHMAGSRDASICGRNLTSVEREGAVSYSKAIKALLPDADLEPYRGKPSQYWLLK